MRNLPRQFLIERLLLPDVRRLHRRAEEYLCLAGRIHHLYTLILVGIS